MKPTIKASAPTPGGHGAGVLLFCPSTERFLFLRRSSTGDGEGMWCCPGGTVEDHETVEQAVRRECEEEIGYRPDCDLIHMNRHTHDNGFCFHNHLGLVDEEFTPTLNQEHTEYVWSTDAPEPMLPALKESMEQWQGRQGV